MAFLDDVDVVVIHVNAADEEAHQRHVAGKVKAIELADAQVVGPVVQHLRNRFGDGFQVAVFPTITPVSPTDATSSTPFRVRSMAREFRRTMR